MATEFKLPNLGENIESGEVVKVLVSVGDEVEEQQPLLEIETDKAVVEVPSPMSCVVEEILVKEGDQAEVGKPVLKFRKNEESSRKAKEATEEEKGEAGEEGDEADKKKKESKAEGKSGKARREEARDEAKEREGEEEVKEEKEARSSEDAGEEEEPAAAGKRREESRSGGEVVDFSRSARTAVEPTLHEVAPASPSVRRFARELGVDIHHVPGTGVQGRITTDDVKKYVQSLVASTRTRASAAPVEAVKLPDFSRWGDVEREKFSNVRRKTAEKMHASWLSVARVTHYDKADVTALEEARKRYARRAEAAGGKLTVTAVLLRVAAAALKVFPKFNASLDMQREEVVYKKYFHIGVAVDTERGLLVPVIRDVDRKNVFELAGELNEVAEKARKARLGIDEMQGGCFTITNLGGIGGTQFSPIVNIPEVAILGVSRASTEAVYRDGGFEPRLMLPLSLSYDHRLIDGADAARFVRWIASALEDPILLILEG